MKTKMFLRFCWFTLAWCFFFPLFFIKNRGLEISGDSWTNGVFIGGNKTIFKLKQLLYQFKLISLIQLFWSKWNPAITTETTRPLYKMCGGDKRPFFASIVVFLYSGVFLHGYCMATPIICLIEMINGNGKAVFEHFNEISFFSYLSFGFFVAIANTIRLRKIKKMKINQNNEGLVKIEAVIA